MIIKVHYGHSKAPRNLQNYPELYAAAATTGVAAGAVVVVGAASAGLSSGFGSAEAGASSFAGFSRGATGAGSSILGGFSSTLAGAATSVLVLGLKKSPTRADKRRPTLEALLDFFSSFFSSF